jgi:hypothetical protein
VAKSAEDPLVAQAFNAKKHDDLARAIEKLTPDEAAFFLHKLEHAVKKRKIQLVGYLAAMAIWLLTMVLAIVYYGTHDGFAVWAFIVPFGCVGAILYGFGRWADRVGKTPPPEWIAVPAVPAAASATGAADAKADEPAARAAK